MKIAPAQIEATVATLHSSNEYRACLLYGPEQSVIDRRLADIVDNFKKDGGDVVNVNPENLKSRPSLLQEEFCAVSMFSAKTLVVLKLMERENTYTKYLEELFKLVPEDNHNFLVVAAGDLESSSSLRKYCDASKAIASIGCYEESTKNVAILLNKKLKEYGFSFDADITNYLVSNVGTNVLLLNKELEKINLYKGEDRKLSLNDVKACVADIATIDADVLLNEFCSFNRTEVFRIFYKLMAEGASVITLMRMLSRYFLQLQRMQYRISQGASLDEVVEKERIFWKQKAAVKDHLHRWRLESINLMLERLMDLEKTIKFSSNCNMEFENFLLKSILYFNR